MTDTEHADDGRVTADVPQNHRVTDLTAIQRDILWALSRLDRPKGVQVKDALDDYYVEPVAHGWLYPNLDQLARRGLLDKRKRDERTNEYRLTTAGRRALSRRYAWIERGGVSDPIRR